ncbi:bifunctional lysylphosphatidylglycerol flippase/synthetase MprF [Sphingomonas sediminicola]|uniref:bifunctional lysylphosphatidylglycerol flippase/synthetase MprF n=1 Tax=Sphingomonas sediminicola TaxID=386874 RepID=UPI003CE736C4
MSSAAPKLAPPRLTLQVGALILASVIALLAFEVIDHMARDLHPAELRHAIGAIGPWRVAAALMLTCASYVTLSFYDAFAFRLLKRNLSWRQTRFAAFSSYAISNNLGLALITGGSARYAHYSRFGLTPSEITRVVLLCSGAFWTALLLLCSLVLLTGPPGHRAPLPAPLDVRLQTVALAMLFVLVATWCLAFGVKRVRRCLLGTGEIDHAALIALQTVAIVDVLFAAGALFILVAGDSADLQQLALAYALAIVAGVASHVPGGMGVFEASFLLLAGGQQAKLFAAVLLYRLIYYLLPLTVALIIQGARWVPRIAPTTQASATAVARLGRTSIPALAAAFTAFAGIVLLLSAATPAVPHRLVFVERFIPPLLVETSHFLISLLGTVLLLLGPALFARLRSALILATGLLVAGALLCFTKGIDYEEGIVLVIVAAFLQMNAGSFYRSAGIGTAPLGALWWGVVLSAVAIVGVTLFATQLRGVAELTWWSFEFGHEASRSLRGLLAATILLGAVGLRQLLTIPAPGGSGPLLPDKVLERSLSGAERTDGMLALTGDKQFLVAPEQDAFLMYRVQRRTWVVMGDPVGPKERWADLAWRLRESADREAGLVCFYEISDRMLPIIVDLGLVPIKYGEEALIDTRCAPRFSRSVRSSIHRAEREGLEFAVLPAAELDHWFPVLKDVSDDWLSQKHTDEKTFSLGRFDTDYLRHFDCAVVRKDDNVVAFANLWTLPNHREASIDLMRRRHDAPAGTMEFLIAKCIMLAAEQGFERFSLGVAPLAGLANRPLAPRWARLGSTVYRHGQRLYSFKGLREFKQKFRPQWEGRYVGTLGGWRGWLSLLDTARLIGD